MTVDALRLYFRDLSTFLQHGKVGSEIVNDLAAIERGLVPFSSMPLKQFSEFLVKAKDYDPNAVVGKVPARKASAGTAKATVDIEGISATIKHLYDTATRPDTTIESINAGLEILDGLTGPNLKIVAKAIKADRGLTGKSVSDVRDIIKNAVRGMWGSAQRVKQ